MTERAKAAYAAYGESRDWKNFQGDAMPQFHELPEPIQQAWDAACEGTLRHWLDIDFRAALQSDTLVKEAGRMMSVGKMAGDDAVECIRVGIAAFVIDLIAPNAIARYPGENP
jgi:hypothetical protein